MVPFLQAFLVIPAAWPVRAGKRASTTGHHCSVMVSCMFRLARTLLYRDVPGTHHERLVGKRLSKDTKILNSSVSDDALSVLTFLLCVLWVLCSHETVGRFVSIQGRRQQQQQLLFALTRSCQYNAHHVYNVFVADVRLDYCYSFGYEVYTCSLV